MTIVAERTDEMARDNAMALRLFRSFSDMLLNLPRSVGLKAKEEANAILKSNLGDNDARAEDIWGRPDLLQPLRDKLGLGSEEAASGGGAEAMVHRYSTDTKSGDGSTAAYTEMARMFSKIVERVEAAEKAAGHHERALLAITELLAKALGKSDERFPEKQRSAKTGDEDDERADDGEEVGKGGELKVHICSVPKLMQTLASRSRSGHSGLAPPPDMAMHIGKSRSVSEIMDGDGSLSMDDRTDAIALTQLAQLVSEGRVPQAVFRNRYFHATEAARRVFDTSVN